MELAGMPFDATKQEVLLAGLTKQRDQYLAALGEALEGRNPASGAQLAEWITGQLSGASAGDSCAAIADPASRRLPLFVDAPAKGQQRPSNPRARPSQANMCDTCQH